MNSLIKGILISSLLHIVTPASRDLYNTKKATSDLKWTAHPTYDGWEEVSGLDTESNTIRYNQVCNIDADEPQDNWIRSPYIPAQSAKLVYLDIEYSMMKCADCRETFTLYYYASSTDVSTSTFPPWRERPYIKIDKVAAGNRFNQNSNSGNGINEKTFAIGPLRRRGLYLAAQDQGACMSLMSVRVYYYYCPEITHQLAYFPETIAGEEVASLIAVNGKCVSNAVYGSEAPKYRCNSNGEWKVPTGTCECRAGYQPNQKMTACTACPTGFYKASNGNHKCTKCPTNSASHAIGSSICRCDVGYYRATQDSIEHECTKPPTRPRNITAIVNKTTVVIRWAKPSEDGGRTDLHYSAVCDKCDMNYLNCVPCQNSVQYNPTDTRHIKQQTLELRGLEMYSYYKLKVLSHNAVSSKSANLPAYGEVTFSTNDAVPSVVKHIVLQSKSHSSLTFSWSPPARLHDIVTSYQVHASILTTTETPSSSRPDVASKHAPIIKEVSSLNCSLTGLDSSTYYQVKIRAMSKAGPGRYSDPIVFVTSAEPVTEATPQKSNNLPIIIGAAAGVLILVIIVIIVLIKRRNKNNQEELQRERVRSKMAGTGEAEPLNNQDLVVLLPPLYPSARNTSNRTYVDYRDPHKGVKEQHAKEIDCRKIKIEKVIGQGEFGEVCKGKLIEGKKETSVAVKRLKKGASLIDQTNFLREACTMAQFKHKNILELKGVVTKSIPAMIISEYMGNGSLDSFLRKNEGRISVVDLLKMLRGIASGMRYLSEMQYVHRDLAARNILVDEDYTCKVSDFGLSRTLENDPRATYTTQGGKIPIRWTAPDCFRYRQFTSASDVWSYGIVMWEVMSFGEKPYWEMTNEDVTESIEKGYRLPAPADCPLVIHQLMLDCWSYDPVNRPTFEEILTKLVQYINNPELLRDCGPPTNGSSLVNPDSPNNVFKFDDWLEVMNLSNYRQQFEMQGLANLDRIAQISESDIERLGIAEPVLRERLQSGIETLRRHRSPPHSPTALTLPSSSQLSKNTAVAFSTTPRSALGACNV